MHYANGYPALFKIAKVADPVDQLLFLIPEAGNTYDKNAVMCHDGVRKLGYVSKQFSAEIRALFTAWKSEDANVMDQVIVVKFVGDLPSTLTEFSSRTPIFVQGISRLDERPARKYAQHQRFLGTSKT